MKPLTVAILAGAALVAAVYIAKKTGQLAGAAAKAVGAAVDPTNPGNVVNEGVSKVGSVLTGDAEFSLGAWLYNITHPDEGKSPVIKAKTPAPSKTAPPPIVSNGTLDKGVNRDLIR